MSSADLALQDTGALAAAEYGRLAVRAHSPRLSGLGTASTAAGQCISAGAPPQPLTRFPFLLLAFVTRALRLYSILVFPQSSEVCSLVLDFVFRFLLLSVFTG